MNAERDPDGNPDHPAGPGTDDAGDPVADVSTGASPDPLAPATGGYAVRETFTHVDVGTDERLWRSSGLLADALPIVPVGPPCLVVVAAHPDDETLGAGGLLARAASSGADIRVIIASDGEASHPDSPTHSPAVLAGIRRREVEAAVSMLAPAATVRHLGLPDGDLMAHLVELTAQIAEVLDGAPSQTLVAVPWRGDRHPDHRAVALAADEALTTAGAPVDLQLLEYPIWAWHWSHPERADLPAEGLRRLDLRDAEIRTKLLALAEHRSQTAPLSPRPGDETLLSTTMLEHFHRPFEIFVVGAGDHERADPVRSEAGSARARRHFEDLYSRDVDPWGFDDRWYEKRKRGVLMASLPRAHYRHAFEPGCANGTVTMLLAERCDEVLAMDLATSAVERARERLAHHPRVRVEQGAIPDGWPAGTFDLIVLSEIAYYCSDVELGDLIEKVCSALADDATVVLCHWRHPAASHPNTAERVHRAFRSDPRLDVLVEHQEADFLLDVLVPSPARSVAAIEGLV